MSPSTYRIYCKRDTGMSSVLPLVCMVANAHVWMLSDATANNWFPMFAIFLASDVIAIGYVTVFCCFAHDRKKALCRVIMGGTTLGLVTVYAILGNGGYTNQSSNGVDTILGILDFLAGLSMFCSSFERIIKVLHYKSAAFILIPMVAAGALNNVMWIVHCPMITSWFLFGCNALCLFASSVNIVLYIIYNPKTHPLRLEEGDRNENLARVEQASISKAPSPLQSDDISVKTKQNLLSPVYHVLHSPVAGMSADVRSST